MLPLVFIGGALTGAAGLLGAALYDKHKTEAEFSPLLKKPESMTADEVEKQLNSYFFKAQAIYSECNKTVIEGSELIFTPIPLPDDSIFQKAANILGSAGNKFCRRNRVRELETLMEDAHKLYGRYKGVFKRANAILQERGNTPVDLSPISKSQKTPAVNNSLENDDWSLELEACADAIRDFIETSCAKAEELMEHLNQKKSVAAITANADA